MLTRASKQERKMTHVFEKEVEQLKLKLFDLEQTFKQLQTLPENIRVGITGGNASNSNAKATASSSKLRSEDRLFEGVLVSKQNKHRAFSSSEKKQHKKSGNNSSENSTIDLINVDLTPNVKQIETDQPDV